MARIIRLNIQIYTHACDVLYARNHIKKITHRKQKNQFQYSVSIGDVLIKALTSNRTHSYYSSLLLILVSIYDLTIDRSLGI